MKKTNIFKKALALTLAAVMLVMVASCGNNEKNTEAETQPEMDYPKLSEKYYNGDGELVSEDLYEYDADGHLVSRKYTIYNMNEMGLSGLSTETGREAVGKYEYENDRLSKFTFHETYSGSGYEEDSVYSYAYDTNGLVKEIKRTENGKYTGKTSYMRDGSGKVKRMIYYNESGGFNGMIEHKYDASGRCVEEKEYDTQSTKIRYIYRYDQSGNLTEWVSFGGEYGTLTHRYAFGSGGELLRESVTDGDGDEYCVIEYAYDEAGRKKSKTWNNYEEESFTVTEYDEYDDNGNCLKISIYDERHALFCRYEYEYGSEKVQRMGWELQGNRFHSDFLL